jgi:hypothetical protein
MKNGNRIILRYGPLLLTLIAALVVLVGARRIHGERRIGKVDIPLLPLTYESPVCPDPALPGLSERAATMTGYLALVEREERPSGAATAARQIRILASQAEELSGGSQLAAALHSLAAALEGYAGGDTTALGDVREASARNAQLRHELYQYQNTCGGEP